MRTRNSLFNLLSDVVPQIIIIVISFFRVKIFLEFKKNLSYSEIMCINNTYRNSQELIDIASNFIVKNLFVRRVCDRLREL